MEHVASTTHNFILGIFGLSFSILTGFDNEFGSAGDIFFTVYSLQLGNFDQDTYKAPGSLLLPAMQRLHAHVRRHPQHSPPPPRPFLLP